MNIPFLRGLTATIGSNVSSLKKQAKRLHKTAPEVFGHPVTLEQCQEALARAIGFQRWADVNDLAIKAGLDQSLPFWHIQSRIDVQETILSALVETEVNLNENGPVVFLGKTTETAATAVCLWVETISLRRVPGVILVNTENTTLQDTAIGDAISSLGLTEMFSQFRVIDARENSLPVSISATPKGWVRIIVELLPNDERDALESSGGWHLFERAAWAYGSVGRWVSGDSNDVPFGVMEKAARLLSNPEVNAPHLLDFLSESDKVGFKLDVEKYGELIPSAAITSIRKIVDAVSSRSISLGRVLWQESLHRPMVVLFNQNDVASTVIAGAIHEMYYWRNVQERAVRPILYFNDTPNHAIPRLICFGNETIITNGSLSRSDPEWQSVVMKKALFGEINGDALSFSGRKSNIK